jgi:hypothetical protein
MGAMTSQSFWAKPDKILVRRKMPQMPGGEMVMGRNGAVGWMHNAMAGGYTLIEGPQLEQMLEQASMHIGLFQMKEKSKQKGMRTETVGTAEFDGRTCYEVRILQTDESGAEQPGSAFFDAETGLPAGMAMEQQGPGGPQKATIVLREWTEVGGIKFFQQMDMTSAQMKLGTKFTEIRVNEVDPSTFDVPQEVREMAARSKTAEPADYSTMSLDDFSPAAQKMVGGILESAEQQTDPKALRMMRDSLEAQTARLPGEYKTAMEYAIYRIDQRIKTLEGGGGSP